jgi:hypothetical protein
VQFLFLDLRLTVVQAVIATDDLEKALADREPAQAVLARPNLKGVTIVLAGHTDATGNDYNMELSQRRADAVRDYLVSGQPMPIPRKLLIPVGFGEIQRQRLTAAYGSSRSMRRSAIADGDKLQFNCSVAVS